MKNTDDVKKEQTVSSEFEDKSKKTEEEYQRKVTNAEVYMNSECHAAIVLARLHGDLDTVTVMRELNKSADNIISDKTNEIEHMLITHAKMLEYVFMDSLRKLCAAEMEHAAIYANVALRAQNQIRKTLIALADLKNPRRATFIKQQNNAINQQINNHEKSESKNSGKVANKLVSEKELEKMDNRGTLDTIAINPATETVVVLDRT